MLIPTVRFYVRLYICVSSTFGIYTPQLVTFNSVENDSRRVETSCIQIDIIKQKMNFGSLLHHLQHEKKKVVRNLENLEKKMINN